MNYLPTTRLIMVAAAALLALGAPLPAASAAKKPKPNKAAAKIAREIVELERSTNVISGEVAALSARTATLEGAPVAQTVIPTAATPIPAPPAPAGGDLSGTFPDPKLLPKTVGTAQLAESSVDSSQVIDGSILGTSALVPESIGGNTLGALSGADYSSAASSRTLGGTKYVDGEFSFYELGRDDGETLSLNINCPSRILEGGWNLHPGTSTQEVMASVPAFFAGGKGPERDWIVSAREQTRNATARQILYSEGLCLE
jgi:hypothetical protein